MNKILKPILDSFRKLAAVRLNAIDAPLVEQSMIFKAANIVAAEKVEGDYLEFGVYSGGSFKYAYNVIEQVFQPSQKPNGPERSAEDKLEILKLWEKMRFFAFDSFEGLPELDGIDKQSRDFVKGKYTCKQEVFLENLTLSGVSLSKVIPIVGMFEETCREETIWKYGMKKAAIIHIDCDLYASAKLALEFVKPLLTDGSVIIFDDWYCFRGNPNLGEQRAFNEWTANMTDWSFSEYQKEGPWGNSFIANRRSLA